MVINIIRMINIIVQLITLLVIIKVFLSYFLLPYHPLRYNLDRIIEPMLVPIRKFIPLIGSMDLSPLVLIIIIQVFGKIVISLLSTIS